MTEDSREPRLQAILHEYLQALDRGEKPDRQALLDGNPDLRAELADYFADASKLERMAQSLKTAAFDTGSVASPSLGHIRYFGDYELLEEIARGGMGVVFKARQVSLNRIVALKMILKGELATEADVRRFRQEAEAAANLDHPNIVPIYEVGDHDGQHYFSMKLIATQNPADPQEPREVAQRLARVARAVHHAHQRGILHRDLKPSNILIDGSGEPHVADFGLAKKVDGAAEMTRSGVILGTPAYMAPEQARVEKGLTTAVDVYSLGAILYEWLTGQPPFRGADVVATLMKAATEEPPSLRSVNPLIDRDLETICLKCLQKEPDRRYGSAALLADDLDRFLDGSPIQARPTRPLESVVKWTKRKPAIASLLAALLLSLIGGTAAATLFALHANDHARKADDNARTANANATTANNNALRADHNAQVAREERAAVQRQLYAARMGQAQLAWDTAQIDWLKEILEGQRPEKTGNVELRGFEWHYWRRRAKTVWELPEAMSVSPVLAYHPEGTQFARFYHDTVALYDADTGKELRVFKKAFDHGGDGLAFSPDGKTLLAIGVKQVGVKPGGVKAGESVVQAWNLETGLPAFMLSCGKFTMPRFGTRRRPRMACSSNGLLATESGGEVLLWNLAQKSVQARIEGGATDLMFSADGKRLALARGSSVEVFDTADGSKTLICEPTRPMLAIAFSPDGRWLAEGGLAKRPSAAVPKENPHEDKAITIWDAATGKVRHALHGDGFPQVEALAFSPDSRWLASGETSGKVIVWDVATGLTVVERRGLRHPIVGLAFRPKMPPHGLRHLAAATHNRVYVSNSQVRVWDITGVPDYQFLTADGPIVGIAFSPDNKLIAGIPHGQIQSTLDGQVKLLETSNHRVEVWDRLTGTKVREFPQPGPVGSIVFSPDSRLLAANLLLKPATDNDLGRQRTDVWDVATGKMVFSQEFTSYMDRQAGVAFSPDGKRLAHLYSPRWEEGAQIRGVDVVRVRDLDSGKILWQNAFPWHNGWGPITGLAFSPTGNEVAAVAFTAVIWDAHTGAELFVPQCHKPGAVAFHPQASTLAIADKNNIELVDFRAKKVLATLKGHNRPVTSLSFSPDGRRLASTGVSNFTESLDDSVRLWDLATGQTVLTLPGRACVAFSSDGKALAAAGVIHGTAVIWNID